MLHMSLEGDHPLPSHVGGNLRRLRAVGEMSQTELALRSGLSRRTIIKIEAGEANPSLFGLDHLAQALGVSLVDLVAAPASTPSNINEVAWRGVSAESRAVLLGAAPARGEAELWEWTLAPGERYDAERDATGSHAMVYVASGALRIDREDGRADLAAGGHCVFQSDQRFSYINIGDTPVQFVRIVTA
jgi:transcriptional regulator with XRE-family HTH domain